MANDINSQSKSDDSTAFGDLVIQGLGSPYYRYGSNTLSFSSLPKEGTIKGEFEYIGPDFPKDIQQLGSERGWVLIANHANFYAFLSIPDRDQLYSRELLVYNRLNNEYRSILVEGAETELRLVNGFLAGVVAYTNKKTNRAKRMKYRPIYSNSSVIINPLTFEVDYYELGEYSEILWVEDESFLYRTENELYSANTSNGSIVTKELLIKATEVFFIHWAIEVSE